MTCKQTFLFFICATLIPLSVSAHSNTTSIEVPVGERIVDIGYNRTFEAGVPILLDLGIKNADQTTIPFTDTWVRVSHHDQTMFSAPIFNGALGGARVTYVFPQAGTYTATVRFYNDGKEIVTADVPIDVIAGETKGPLWPIVVVGVSIISLATGVGIGLLARRARKRA